MVCLKPIGIFDSGIGGLTVLQKLQRNLPYENFVYFADTVHLPYGEKSPAQIIEYSRRILTWMQEEIEAKLVVIACHTSSALALDVVSHEFDIPLVGTIYPMTREILSHEKYSRLGIIATLASVNSRIHERVLLESGFRGYVCSISCPEFVPLIEAGQLKGERVTEKAREYLEPFHRQDLTTLIYGCTHYPWIADTIQRLLPARTLCFDPAESMAAQAACELKQRDIINPADHPGTVHFYCSGSPPLFSSQLGSLLSIPPPPVSFRELKDPYAPSLPRVVNL